MAHLTVVITGCKNDQLLSFLKALGFDQTAFTFDGLDAIGNLEKVQADKLYHALEEAAATAWRNVDAEVLEFDSAYFPASATAIHPVRQLRGTSTSQVVDAEVALVTGAITDPSGAVLLGRG